MIPGICKTEFSINIHVTALFDTMSVFFVHYLLISLKKTHNIQSRYYPTIFIHKFTTGFFCLKNLYLFMRDYINLVMNVNNL